MARLGITGVRVKKPRTSRGFSYEAGLVQNALFLQRPDRLSAKNHGDFLAVHHEGLFLKVRLEDAVGAPQREADVVAKLFAFAGKFIS